MHQPIQWHEWGEEAFAKATRENKPILLDIGAVWCHWCHVMDRESYENAEMAAIVNEHFVAIKVDRDERPDVDARYQSAVQAMSGQGGWPLTAFLTPDGHPFFGGTYFPPDDRYGRPGFKHVLQSIAKAYAEKHADVLDSAASVMQAIAHQESFSGRSGTIDPKTVDNILESAVRQFDRIHGGFGTAPKFAHPAALDLVIDEYARTGNDAMKHLFAHTLERMAMGGVYDQLAGGFHRYSVDEKWIVPHFEKMSYDNSELLKNYVHAYQATGDGKYAAVAKDIIRWVDEWLSDREHGGFYASQDADLSLEDDGDYFTWTRAEAREVLTGEEFAAAAEYYDIGEIGEMHHNHEKNVLFVAKNVSDVGARLALHEDAVFDLLAAARKKMYAKRLERLTPYIDKTMYVNWNAMMISAYLLAARALDSADVMHFALRSLDRILAEGWSKDAKRLAHVVQYSDPAAQRRDLAGHLDDYAFTISACLDAYEITGAISYFHFAAAIGKALLVRFFDPEGGGFFDTDATTDPASLIGALTARRKPLQDSPTPAGNSAAIIALVRLYHYTDDAALKDAAQRSLECFAGVVDHFGIYAGTYGIALRMFLEPHTQIVVVGNDEDGKTLFSTANQSFRITRSVLHLGEGQVEAANLPPALALTLPNLPGIRARQSMAVLCANFACQPPITLAERLQEALRTQD